MPAFEVSRDIVIEKDPSTVFDAIRDFKTWPVWSPWLPADPECKVSFAEDGKSYSWDGHIAGSGSLAVTDEVQGKEINCDLVFLKPWKSEAKVQLLLDPAEGGTRVNWKMQSKLPIFMFFMKNMMVGAIGMDYERGLLKLKDYLELGEVPSKLDFGTTKLDGFSYIGLKSACSVDDLSASMEVDFSRLESFFKEKSLSPSGPPFSIYHKWDVAKRLAEYTIGFPVEKAPDSLHGDFVSGALPTLDAYAVTHTGAYRHLGNAWSAGVMHGRAKQFAQKRGIHPFEIYANNPAEVEEKDLVTVVHFPVK